MQLDKTLQKYGLTVKESQLYTALLELGQSTILGLSKKTKIKRAGLYYTIKNLAQRGLAEGVKIGPKHYWVATDPDTLLAREDERHRLLTLAMPELRALNNSALGKPQVTYYKGIAGIDKAEMELLKVAAKLPLNQREMVQYGNLNDIMESRLKSIRSYRETPEPNVGGTVAFRIANNIRLKIISPPSPWARRIQTKDKQELRETLILPPATNGEIHNIMYFIVGDRIALYTIDEQSDLSVIIIQHAEQAQAQRFLFGLAWTQLSTRQ
jgi:hypothetical protein